MIPIYLMNFLFAVATTIGMTFIPLLVTDGLGMSLLLLGIIEGSTEFISNILRLVTGNIFDRVRNRRLLFVFPASLALISKLVLFLPNAWTVVTSKITERIANGAFAAPRDAYIGVNAKNKGIGLGLLNAAKAFGCVLGPLIVSGSTLLLGPLKQNMGLIIFLACLVNFIGFSLSFFIDTESKLKLDVASKFNFSELKESFKNLHFIFILSFLFFLGRFNDGMIMIFLKSMGFPEWFYLATISFFNIIMLLISPFMGYLVGRKKDYHVMFVTIVGLFLFNLLYSNISEISWPLAYFGLVCWGIQRAGAQITFSAMIFKRAPVKYYGTAIGIYSLLSGFGVFISSFISGYLAQTSFTYIFILSGTFSLCALLLAFYMYRKDNLNVDLI